MDFITLCLQGRVFSVEIDDWIDAWHKGDYECELYEFLGMSKEEYGDWVECSKTIEQIIEIRFNKENNETF